MDGKGSWGEGEGLIDWGGKVFRVYFRGKGRLI
jgi:hypothetical protein